MAVVVVAAPALQAEEISVPMPTRNIAAGERLEASLVEVKPWERAKVYASTIRSVEELGGMQAVRELRAGVPISRLHVKPATDVNRGSVVTIVYRKPGIQLTGSGQALEDGRMGESIRILNTESRATLVGTVVAEGMVEIK